METTMIKNRDFIMFGLQPWDIPIGSNFKNMAIEIAKSNRVLYVNRPLDRISFYRNRKNRQIKSRIDSLKKGENVLTQPEENLFILNPRVILESVNWLPDGALYDFLNRRNCCKLAKEINEAAGSLGFNDPILLIDNDFFNGQYLAEFLKPSLFVYYIRDFLLSQDYFIKHGERAEPSLMKKADGVAANSLYLANYAGKHNSKSADIGQGCDVEEFLQIPDNVPEDVKQIKSPVIGYCGSLTATRLDVDLIGYLAKTRPGWNIVLVGPEDEKFRASQLHSYSNVFFIGSKMPSELPAYVHFFDVCINPQVLNQMTIGNYPRKVDEYLAAGKPVVATKTEAMEMFRSQCFLCDSKEDYITAIDQALHEAKDTEKINARKTMAQSHTWAASVEKMYTLIKSIENGRK